MRHRKRERERDRKRERCKMVKTQKWYYLCNMRSAYFHTNRILHRERERERQLQKETERRDRDRKREMGNAEHTEQYCVYNMRSAYFPIIGR